MAISETLPEDFYSLEPPIRVIGAECEYRINAPGFMDGRGMPVVTPFIKPRALANAGLTAWYDPAVKQIDYFLTNGARLYEDMGHAEYCSAEAAGPLEATLSDMAGRTVMTRVVSASGIKHEGIYRRSGSNMPNSEVKTTSGFHENYLIPRGLLDDGSAQEILASFLATRFWTGGGIVTDKGFQWSQKISGIGSIQAGLTTSQGQKPMFRIKPLDEYKSWQRLEVRFADPLQSPLNRFVAFGATSLVLRVMEHAKIAQLEAGVMPAKPVQVARQVMADPLLRTTFHTKNGNRKNALAVQKYFLRRAQLLVERGVNLPADELLALQLWEETLLAFQNVYDDHTDLKPAARYSDAAAKRYHIMHNYGEDVRNTHAKAVRSDMHWDKLETGKGTEYGKRATAAHELARTALSPEVINDLVFEPPKGTAAEIRTEIIGDPKAIISYMFWDRVIYRRWEKKGERAHHDKKLPYTVKRKEV